MGLKSASVITVPQMGYQKHLSGFYFCTEIDLKNNVI